MRSKLRAALLHETLDDGQVTAAVRLNQPSRVADELAKNLAFYSPGQLGRLNQDPATIVGIVPPPSIAGSLKAIDHRRHSAGGHPKGPSQGFRGQRAGSADELESPGVGGVQAKPVGRQLIDTMRLVGVGAYQREHDLYEMPASWPIIATSRIA